jgi:CHAT domain-containing protein
MAIANLFDSFAKLGDRRDQRAIEGLEDFPSAHPSPNTLVLVGSNASEQHLDRLARAGCLKRFRFLHLATHGKADPRDGLQSHLVLAQDHLPDPLATVSGERTYDGKLTAREILQTWHLNADLVTLSACETGLGEYQGGEGYLGFTQALFLAGARNLVLSLWQVDDRATVLLMHRFYQNLLGRRWVQWTPEGALSEAKQWLRSLPADEVGRLLQDLPGGQRLAKADDPSTSGVSVKVEATRPYEHPHYWASFILIGDSGRVSQAVPVLATEPAGLGKDPVVISQEPAWPTWLLIGAGVLAAFGRGLVLAYRRRAAA